MFTLRFDLRAPSHGAPIGELYAATLEMVTKARGSARYTMHFTYRKKYIEDWIKEDKRKNNRKYKVSYRDEPELSLWIDLGDELDF